MKKRLNRKSSSAEPQVKPDVVELIIKMQQQLVSLEKKIDTLLSQSTQRPFEAKSQSGHLRSFVEPSHGRAEARYGHDRGSRPLFRAICADCNKECEVPFKPSQGRPVYCKECFSRRKAGSSFKANIDNRPDNRPKEAAPAKDTNIDKPQASEKKKPVAKKKSVEKKKLVSKKRK